MIRMIVCCLFAAAACFPAAALQQFSEYRIPGHEILSVKVEPHVDEDPAAITLQLAPNASGSKELVLETDMDIEPCKAAIEEVIGNAQAYVQIVVHLTAQTMNGVVITQCSALYGLSNTQ